MVIKKNNENMVKMLDGVVRQSLVQGDNTHLVKFYLSKGKSVPVHSHREEQTGFMVSGNMVMSIDGVDYDLKEGDSWSIKGNIPHGAKMKDDCIVVEVFSPVRKDYL